MSFLIDLFEKVTHSGISEQTPLHLKKRISVINKSSLTIALITIPYIFIFYFAGFPLLGYLVIPIVLGYLLVVMLNRWHFYDWSGLTMIMTGNVAVTSYSLAFGSDAGIHLYYFALIFFPFIVFESVEMKKIIFGLLLPIALYCFVQFFGFQFEPWVYVEPSIAHIIDITLYFSTFATIVAASLYIVGSTSRAEKQLLLERQKAEDANRAKSAFLANMSHEIRTPLGIIQGYLNVIEDSSNLSSEQKKLFEVVRRNSEQLVQIIEDILDISKIEVGKIQISMENVRIRREIESIVSQFEAKLDGRDVDLQLEWMEPVPASFVTDPYKFHQILSNLVSNAVKFTKKGYIKIRVSYESPRISVEVIDSGIGIGHEEQEKLFDSFVQANDSLARKYGDTGLGLNIAKKLAHALNGDVRLKESRPDQGSHFVLEIPDGESRNMEILNTSVEKADTDSKGSFSGRRMLVVEDNPDNQLVLKYMLEDFNCVVIFADTAEEGIEMALSKNVDAVFMDIQLPDMMGYEAAEILKNKKFDKPIIAITAYALKEVKDRCLSHGCCDFITKPIDKKTLHQCLDRWLT